MRYVAIIALIDFVVLTVAGVLTQPYTDIAGAMFIAFFICLFGIPVALILGIPLLWIARWLSPGSIVPLAVFGIFAGALCPFIYSLVFPLGQVAYGLGVVLGLVSAVLWWALVERHPDRRIYYA